MRIISMHKTDQATEAGAMPSAEVLAGIGPLLDEMTRAGVMVAGEGLRPSSTGVRLRFAGGKRTITPGPFAGENELIAGFCIVKVQSMDQAIEWASRYAAIFGDAEIDIRPVTEAWDLGFMPKPATETRTRFMIAHKADRAYEAGAQPSAEQIAAIERLKGEMGNAGILVMAEGIQPSSRGVRLNFSKGKRTVRDGPFAESKELIGGFSIMNVQSMDEAIEWADRFARVFGDVEMDIRPLDEGSSLS